MYADEIIYCGYEAGTFKLGQTIYPISNKIYRFRFHKKCAYCDNTGKILVKGKEFKCPECNGSFETKEIIEKILSKPEKIKSVISFKNRNKSLEIYTNDSSGYGLKIKKQEDKTNTYFGSKEEAQDVCDRYNKEHNIDLLLEEYSRQKVRKNI